MRPESIQRAAGHFARFYHEEPDDAAGHADAFDVLRDDQVAAAREALQELLAADLPPGTLKQFVRRHANRLSYDDEHARQFIEDSLKALDG